MSDDPSAGSNAAGEVPGAPAAQPVAPGANPPANPGGSETPDGKSLTALGDDGVTVTTPSDWPDDWRDRFAGKDEGFGKLLKRFTSPENFAKAYTGLQKKLSSAPAALTPPDKDATEEQVAEYRKAIGVPETPEGYEVKIEGVPLGDVDKTILAGVLAGAHAQHIPAAHVKAMVGAWAEQAARAQEEQVAAAQRSKAQVQNELRREYGADFKRNLGLGQEFLEAHPGIAKFVRPDAPDIELLRDIIALARDSADEEALYGGDGAGGGKSMDDRIVELRTKSVTGKLTKAEDAEYMRLLDGREKRNAKQRTRAA